MNEIVVKSPAKINIGLNIIDKREDGFHNLETIFYPIDLFDVIRFVKSEKFSFNCNDVNLNRDKTNLIIKAKELLEQELCVNLPVNIYLNKNIPIGAGLGGGSSNSASTLLALNNLYMLQIESNKISELSLILGSDVPFFLHPVSSYAESRGEIIVPINLKLNKYLLIVNPGIHISTKWAFGLITPKKTDLSLKSLISKSEIKIEELMSLANNDFENIVFKHFPEVKEIKDKMLENGASFSMMTGTGSTVWGIFDDAETAHRTKLFFTNKNYFTFLNKTI